MDRRRLGVVAVVFALLVATSGCSLREVQLWFLVNRKVDISRDQARALADVINSKKAPGGCDSNYAGGCVPDNATTVHCAGTDGEGPAVRGPLTIVGWDSFELDPHGLRKVCDDPVGNLDVFGQLADRIVVRGWVFDPDTTGPVTVTISDPRAGGQTTLVASDPRPDVEGAFPGAGTNHGFSWNGPAGIGTSAFLCVGGTNLGTGWSNWHGGCKFATVLAPGTATVNSSTVIGLVEGADRVSGGLHVRGFVVRSGPDSLPILIGGEAGTIVGGLSVEELLTVPRPDVDAALSVTGAVGFDFLVPDGPTSYRPTGICISTNVPQTTALMCRPVNT